MGMYFGMPVDLQLFRICIRLLCQFALACIHTHTPTAHNREILTHVLLAAGSSVQSISDSVVPLLPYLSILDPTSVALQGKSYEEVFTQMVDKVRTHTETTMFDLLQVERVALYLSSGKERVSAAAIRCLVEIGSVVNALIMDKHPIKVWHMNE